MNEARQQALEAYERDVWCDRMLNDEKDIFRCGYDAGQRDTNESLTRQLSTAKAALEAIIKEMDNCGSSGATHAMNECGCQMAMYLGHKALEDIK